MKYYKILLTLQNTFILLQFKENLTFKNAFFIQKSTIFNNFQAQVTLNLSLYFKPIS